MSEPLTRENLVEELDDQLNERFDHLEKRADERHREMMEALEKIVANINAHTTAECEKLRRELARR